MELFLFDKKSIRIKRDSNSESFREVKFLGRRCRCVNNSIFKFKKIFLKFHLCNGGFVEKMASTCDKMAAA